MSEMKVTVIPARRHRRNIAAPEEVKKTRVAAYCRVSTDTDEQETSYDAQIEHFTKYIKERDEWEFAGIYADDGITGTNTKKRDKFNQMIKDAMDGKIDMIITKSISRFARNTLDCLKTVRKLKEKNVPVYFEKENINTMDASGELLLTIMSSIAQQESESLSKNVKIGLQYRFQQGKMSLNYNRFLGYTRDEEGRLVIVPEEAEVVKRIYREYLEGGSTTGIAAGLEADGILTGANRKKWYGTTVDKILRNEKYIGDAILQKTYTVDFLEKKRAKNDGLIPQYYVEDSHEAIISDQIFMEVQAEIARRAALRSGANDKTSFCSKYAFTGVVFCGECGSPFRRLTWTPHGKKMYVWRCRQRVSEGVDSCKGRSIHEEDLHEAVVQAIRQTICNPESEYTSIEDEVLEELSTSNETELKEIEEKLKSLQEAVVQNVNNNDEFDSLVDEIEKLRARKDELSQEQALNNRNMERITELREAIEADRDGALAYSDKLVRDFIEKIEVFPDSLTIQLKAGISTIVKM